MKTAVFLLVILASLSLQSQQRPQRPRRPDSVTQSPEDAGNSVPAILTRPERPRRVPTAIGQYITPNVGLMAQIERRSWPAMYSNGELLRGWNTFDPIVNSTYAQETALQFAQMRAMGVNTIMLELRTADPDYAGHEAFPDCKINYVLGPEWPVPTNADLAGLVSYLDLARSNGIRVWLDLNNTHMDEDPAMHSQGWLNSILSAVKNHPALDLVLFGGDLRIIDLDGDGIPDHCGGQSEAPLWMGATSQQANYVAWAIGYAKSLGIASSTLSAEAIVGDYSMETQIPAGPDATDGHLWSPVAVMKSIFEELKIPPMQRTYALSFYEHDKCLNVPNWWPCTPDVDHFGWADETLESTVQIVGANSAARILAVEFGRSNSAALGSTSHTVEHAIAMFSKYAIGGGNFWRWANNTNDEDADPNLSEPVKRRGVTFTFNPVQKEVVDWGGFHLANIPNRSFETDSNSDGLPDEWTVSGQALRFQLTSPDVPSRGSYALRLAASPGKKSTCSSQLIAVSSEVVYTTTVNLQFHFSGDPNPSAPPADRPQVYVAINYFTADGTPSTIRGADVFRYFQENSTAGFETLPLQYTTPADAFNVIIEIGVVSNGLPSELVADVDNVR